jgi:hypothetical protein
LGLGIAPVSLSAIAIMEFKVAQIGDVTSNGNNIVKLQRKVEHDSPVGTMRRSETYYMAVKEGTAKVKVDETVDLNPSDFTITERPFQPDDSDEIIMLKWLSLS